MITVKEVLQAVEAFAPAYMKESWDNVGLLCGDPSQEVRKILVALDPFEHVCREAWEEGADLIVTHHPLIFQAPKAITTDTSVGRSILYLCRHGISAINAHTNLDCTPGGVNDVFAQVLELQDITVMAPNGVDEEGRPWGLLRTGTYDADLESFLAHVKAKLHTPTLRYADGGRPVHKVAVGGGSCAGALVEAFHAGCDTFVTADVKYNQFWDARELGMNLIDAGHFATENPVVPVLARKLAEAFPEVEVLISQSHGDCMEYC